MGLVPRRVTPGKVGRAGGDRGGSCDGALLASWLLDSSCWSRAAAHTKCKVVAAIDGIRVGGQHLEEDAGERQTGSRKESRRQATQTRLFGR